MDKIKCPKCGHEFELTDAVAGPLIAAARAEAIAGADRKVSEARRTIEAEATAKAQRVQADVVENLKIEAKAASDSERAMSAKLTTAQAAQAEAVRKSREYDDKIREADLIVQESITNGLHAAKQLALAEAEAAIGAKLAERDLTIEGLKRTSEELRRKLEQGSTQTQGEAQELALEAALRARFPQDTVEPVGKGITGGDCLQIIEASGRILWESKQTKAWSAGWLAKLRDDGRAAKADLLVIVTAVLPKGVEAFDQIEGIWVCLPRHAVSLAVALRQALQEVAATRRANDGAQTKSMQIYTYMVGPQFKSRIQAIVEAFSTMQEDLQVEQRAMQKQWGKRSSQLERVMLSTTGLYGDLQAIAGKALAEVEGLDLLAAPQK